jgi:hypothetical protein
MTPNNSTCRFRCNVLPFIIAGLISAVLGENNFPAQQPKFNEYQVKAAYIYNFGRFVTWPARLPGQQNDFAICVLGQDPFGPMLDSTVAGKLLDGKPVVTKRISKAQDAIGCRIVFINASEGGHLQEILTVLNQAPVLTVSDLPDFSRKGGIIQFVLEGNKVRFEVNLTSADTAGLELSSELLKVASSVKGNARAGG